MDIRHRAAYILSELLKDLDVAEHLLDEIYDGRKRTQIVRRPIIREGDYQRDEDDAYRLDESHGEILKHVPAHLKLTERGKIIRRSADERAFISRRLDALHAAYALIHLVRHFLVEPFSLGRKSPDLEQERLEDEKDDPSQDERDHCHRFLDIKRYYKVHQKGSNDADRASDRLQESAALSDIGHDNRLQIPQLLF